MRLQLAAMEIQHVPPRARRFSLLSLAGICTDTVVVLTGLLILLALAFVALAMVSHPRAPRTESVGQRASLVARAIAPLEGAMHGAAIVR